MLISAKTSRLISILSTKRSVMTIQAITKKSARNSAVLKWQSRKTKCWEPWNPPPPPQKKVFILLDLNNKKSVWLNLKNRRWSNCQNETMRILVRFIIYTTSLNYLGAPLLLKVLFFYSRQIQCTFYVMTWDMGHNFLQTQEQQTKKWYSFHYTQPDNLINGHITLNQ